MLLISVISVGNSGRFARVRLQTKPNPGLNSLYEPLQTARFVPCDQVTGCREFLEPESLFKRFFTQICETFHFQGERN
jgi:hypothetical protein